MKEGGHAGFIDVEEAGGVEAHQRIGSFVGAAAEIDFGDGEDREAEDRLRHGGLDIELDGEIAAHAEHMFVLRLQRRRRIEVEVDEAGMQLAEGVEREARCRQRQRNRIGLLLVDVEVEEEEVQLAIDVGGVEEQGALRLQFQAEQFQDRVSGEFHRNRAPEFRRLVLEDHESGHFDFAEERQADEAVDVELHEGRGDGDRGLAGEQNAVDGEVHLDPSVHDHLEADDLVRAVTDDFEGEEAGHGQDRRLAGHIQQGGDDDAAFAVGRRGDDLTHVEEQLRLGQHDWRGHGACEEIVEAARHEDRPLGTDEDIHAAGQAGEQDRAERRTNLDDHRRVESIEEADLARLRAATHDHGNLLAQALQPLFHGQVASRCKTGPAQEIGVGQIGDRIDDGWEGSAETDATAQPEEREARLRFEQDRDVGADKDHERSDFGEADPNGDAAERRHRDGPFNEPEEDALRYVGVGAVEQVAIRIERGKTECQGAAQIEAAEADGAEPDDEGVEIGDRELAGAQETDVDGEVLDKAADGQEEVVGTDRDGEGDAHVERIIFQIGETQGDFTEGDREPVREAEERGARRRQGYEKAFERREAKIGADREVPRRAAQPIEAGEGDAQRAEGGEEAVGAGIEIERGLGGDEEEQVTEPDFDACHAQASEREGVDANVAVGIEAEDEVELHGRVGDIDRSVQREAGTERGADFVSRIHQRADQRHFQISEVGVEGERAADGGNEEPVRIAAEQNRAAEGQRADFEVGEADFDGSNVERPNGAILNADGEGEVAVRAA